MTNPSKRDRGVKATEEGAKRLKQAKSQLRQTNGRPITYENLASKAQVSVDTVKRFFRNKDNVDEAFAIAICKALELDYCQVVDCSKDAKSKQPPQHSTATGSPSPWPQVCRSMLDRHRRLTTNEWLTDPSSHFNVDDIHIPLSLLERQTKAIRSSNSPAAKGDSAHEASEVSEVCEVQQFTHDAFLDRILREGEGKTQGKRIAIIGEPGAGKTTLLQKIASWILDHELGLPIWISLADLQLHNNRLENLGEYLKNVWLKRAVAFDTPATQAEFSQLVQTGQVWLLLDGLDEISLPFMSALREVRDLLEGWISASRVIVTCRVNVWEASLNALDQFETYRIGQFSPEQIEAFIKNWFAQSNPDQGRDLWKALKDGRNHRIQDLVKSPLRLTLLCSTWQENSTLPETKAALYERFIAALYRWKSDRFSISCSDREKLNKSLGELAKAAIDRGGSAYRLTQPQVDEHLDDQTRNLCLALGWLNSLGDRNQEVYAFIHPTFQEYFAALSIEDSDFFFDPDAEEAHQRSYRIFDARWKEPLLIWFGFNHVSKHDKDILLRKLIYFEDQCEQFYDYRAIFIAASCLTEFPESEYKDEILDQVFDFAFGHPSDDENIINEDGNIIWLHHPIQTEAQDLVFSGEFPQLESINYICNLIERIYLYLHSEIICDDRKESSQQLKAEVLRSARKSFAKRLLVNKFKVKAIQYVPHRNLPPIFMRLLLRLKRSSIQHKVLRDRLTSILIHFNDFVEKAYEQDNFWDSINQIENNSDLGFIWHLSDILLSIDSSSEIGLITTRRILLLFDGCEDYALETLFEVAFHNRSYKNDIDDPILYIAYYLSWAEAFNYFEDSWLKAALMIATILHVRCQKFSDFWDILHVRFEDLQSDHILNSFPVKKLFQYVEACLKKDSTLAIFVLESLREYWNANRKELRIWDPNYGDTIQMKIHAIKKGNSFWWRMPTKEEKQEEIRSSISSNSHPSEIRKEEELKIAGADEDVFLDILSRINATTMYGGDKFSASQVTRLLNESRYPITVRYLKREYFMDETYRSTTVDFFSCSFNHFSVLYHCTKSMSYENFLAAWQGI